MDFKGFDFPNLSLPDMSALKTPLPRIDPAIVEDINRRTQEMADSITPIDEIIANELKPLLEGNQKVVDGLAENYNKLNALFLLKEKELESSKKEAEKAKKYNMKMLIIALASAGIALASLVATILIAVLQWGVTP